MIRARTFLFAAMVFSGLSGAAIAAPVLRAEVTVADPLVTVGDMFADAGALAATPLFRAPAPGTTGIVSLDAVREAAARAGLGDYDADAVARVRVARASTPVDAEMLAGLVDAELDRRGLIGPGVEPETRFDRPDLSLDAAVSDRPARLIDLRYAPGSGSFAARFEIAGIDLPVELTGGIEMMVEVPHLAAGLPAGTVLRPADIELRRVPAKFVSTSGVADIDDLVGKALVRNAQAGLLLKATDVAEPLVVTRNALVTVYLRTGPMTLSVKGQALADASAGAPVDVLNTVTHRILHGTATPNGAVEITAAGNLSVAGL
jgi:flagella basal body P-ring formation protein FlgA